MTVQIACVPGVELARTGQWSASTGVSTITRQDLAEAVSAMACPAVRDPVIKLGHTDPRFDGQPAVGRVTNLSVVDEYSLRGDLDGLPGWLGEILASAYPSRSIEGEWNHRCSVGHTHPFVLTGLALLGVSTPAIGSLSSLDDIAVLWGVEDNTPAEVIAAKEGTVMTKTIAAAATVEDIRRAYYDHASYDLWIEEIQLAPLQLIVVDDIDGGRLRVPVVVDPEADGAETITFGEPVPVVIRYDDVATPDGEPGADAATTSVAASTLRFASRADSLREVRAGKTRGGNMASKRIAAADASGSGDANPGGLTDDQLAKLREACGLTEDADPAVLASALEALVSKVKSSDDTTEETTDTTEETTTSDTDTTDGGDEDDPEKKKVAVAASRGGAAVPQTVTVDAAQFASMTETLGRFEAFERAQAEKRADDMVEAAFKAGKIGRPSVAAYQALARNDFDGTKKVLDSLAASAAFSTGELGHSVDVSDTPDVRQDPAYKNWSI